MFIKWLQGHLLTCPFKFFTGIDCPGCGFQRSVITLAQGNLHQSFAIYPPCIPLIIFFLYGIADGFFKLDTKKQMVKKTGFIIAGTIVMVSYTIKLYGMYAHHNISI